MSVARFLQSAVATQWFGLALLAAKEAGTGNPHVYGLPMHSRSSRFWVLASDSPHTTI